MSGAQLRLGTREIIQEFVSILEIWKKKKKFYIHEEKCFFHFYRLRKQHKSLSLEAFSVKQEE